MGHQRKKKSGHTVIASKKSKHLRKLHRKDQQDNKTPLCPHRKPIYDSAKTGTHRKHLSERSPEERTK